MFILLFLGIPKFFDGKIHSYSFLFVLSHFLALFEFLFYSYCVLFFFCLFRDGDIRQFCVFLCGFFSAYLLFSTYIYRFFDYINVSVFPDRQYVPLWVLSVLYNMSLGLYKCFVFVSKNINTPKNRHYKHEITDKNTNRCSHTYQRKNISTP